MRQRRERQRKPPRYSSDQLIFATWLLQQLRTCRLTGAELGERADVAKASVYFCLDGSRIPAPDAVQKICAALRVDPTSVPAFERRTVGRAAHKYQGAAL